MVTQNMLRTCEVRKIFSEKKIGFDDSFDVTKCLQQIEYLIYSICAHHALNYHLM